MTRALVGYAGDGSPLDVPAGLALVISGLLIAVWIAWAVLAYKAAQRRHQTTQIKLAGRVSEHDPYALSRVGKGRRL